MTIIEQIKAEIERLKEDVPCRYHPYSCASVLEAYEELLSFLSTLESEMSLEDFEKELDNECKRYFNSMTPEQFLNTPNTNVARHFAEWGAKHLRH